jgi:hypothetical protein
MILLAFDASKGFKLYQMDVKSDFLKWCHAGGSVC